MSPQTDDLQSLLDAWHHGDDEAFRRLMGLLEPEIHRIAAHQVARERDVGETLRPTVLVGELYLRLARYRPAYRPENRRQLLGLLSRAVRHVVLDYVRRPSRPAVPWIDTLLEALPKDGPGRIDLLDLDRALERLRELDPVGHDIVELYHFGGFQQGEIAEILDLELRAVRYKWTTTKLLLRHLMEGRD
ncbi:MAG: ECF-type sigma factor [Acidobacteriota bacterium]